MRNFVRKWLGLPTLADQPTSGADGVFPRHAALGMEGSFSTQGTYRIVLYKAANGHIIEFGTFTPQSRGPDWSFEYHLVAGDERLMDVISRVLAVKYLEQ